MQLKIGLPYQIYVDAPRAKLVAWDRVWAAVGARLLKVGLSVLNPPLERGGNAVLDTGWYRMVPRYLRYVDSNAVDIRRYKATKLVPLSLLAGDTRMLIHMMEEKKLTPQ